MVLLRILMFFFREIHVLLHMCEIGLFGINRAYHRLEAPKWQELFTLKNLLRSHRETMW
jgi:hypothetical protein